MLNNSEKFYIQNYLLSKYTYTTLLNFPTFILFNFITTFYYKQRIECLLFLHLLFLIFFFDSTLTTQFYTTKQLMPLNILQIKLRKEYTILKFVKNFIYISLPFLDTFTAEFKIIFTNTIIKLCFFKFPLIYELNVFFILFDYLHIYLNIYKFQIEFYLKTKKKPQINFNYLHFFKIPLG
ncbi:MAG: hypothetical protein JSS98_07900 [Bacteroidetes bacterium]|nr:hypothetical protein [Bacteroidota bacterium]